MVLDGTLLTEINSRASIGSAEQDRNARMDSLILL